MRWRFMGIAVLVCVVMAPLVSWLQPPVYAAVANLRFKYQDQYLCRGCPPPCENCSPAEYEEMERQKAVYCTVIESPAIRQRAYEIAGLGADETIRAELNHYQIWCQLWSGGNEIRLLVRGTNPELVFILGEAIATVSVEDTLNLHPFWKLEAVGAPFSLEKPVAPDAIVYTFFGLGIGVFIGLCWSVLRFVVKHVHR